MVSTTEIRPQAGDKSPSSSGPDPKEIAKKVDDLAARLQMLEQKVTSGHSQMAGSGQSGASTTCLQDVLPDIKDLSEKVGGLNRLSELVDTLKQPK